MVYDRPERIPAYVRALCQKHIPDERPITLADLATKYRDWYATHFFFHTVNLVPRSHQVWERDLSEAVTDQDGSVCIPYSVHSESRFEFKRVGDQYYFIPPKPCNP